MATVIDQDDIVLDANKWTRMFTRARQTQGAQKTVTIKLSSRAPASTKPKNNNYLNIKRAAEQVATAAGLDPDSAAWLEFANDQHHKITHGNFEPKYWLEQILISTEYLTDVPTSVLDDNPKPYAYRTSASKPTVPTYHDGTPGTEPLTATASIDATEAKDTRLTWAKLIYSMTPAIQRDALQPLIFAMQFEITMLATTRGSRPMCSLLIKTTLAAEGDTILSTLTPPIKNALSFYWRYYPPPKTTNEYNVRISRFITTATQPPKKDVAREPANRLMLLIAPRPMFGRGTNNNDSVEVKIYIRPAF